LSSTNAKRKVKVLIFTRFYLPGFKSGGPVRSICNLIEHHGNEIDFKIVTSDRDFLDDQPYPDISTGWQEVGNARVLYMSPSPSMLWNMVKRVTTTKPDLIYINSFFDLLFSFPLILLKCFLPNQTPPLFCAPRGELMPGAMSLKKLRKTFYIQLLKLIGINRHAIFHATSKIESDGIKKHFGSKTNVKILPNIIGNRVKQKKKIKIRRFRQSKKFYIAYLGRIHPKKNLMFVLECIARLRLPCHLNIYGPVDDYTYLLKCNDFIANLPQNITVTNHGPIEHASVGKNLARNDLFLFPTKGENFGHVIIEALSASLPVITSDQTPWSQLDELKLGWCINLSKQDQFIRKIEEVAHWQALDWDKFNKNLEERITDLLSQFSTDLNYKVIFQKIADKNK
jgi:glycosyltransferase involved in cell wall biosynthesis